jgi:hypothetical protein
MVFVCGAMMAVVSGAYVDGAAQPLNRVRTPTKETWLVAVGGCGVRWWYYKTPSCNPLQSPGVCQHSAHDRVEPRALRMRIAMYYFLLTHKAGAAAV